MPAPAFYLSLIPTQDLRFIFLYFWNPPFSLSVSDHVFWHGPSPCLHAYTTYIIPYKMLGYVWSITNHNPWHRYQWFITLATYWLHCDVTVMHLSSFHHWASVLSNTPQRPLVFSILRWIFCNITWFIDNSLLKRSRHWSKRIGHALYWFVLSFCILRDF